MSNSSECEIFWSTSERVWPQRKGTLWEYRNKVQCRIDHFYGRYIYIYIYMGTPDNIVIVNKCFLVNVTLCAQRHCTLLFEMDYPGLWWHDYMDYQPCKKRGKCWNSSKTFNYTKEHIVLTNAGSSSRNTLADLHGNNTIDALTSRGRLLPWICCNVLRCMSWRIENTTVVVSIAYRVSWR